MGIKNFTDRRREQMLTDDPEYLTTITVTGKRHSGSRVLWSIEIEGTVNGEQMSKEQADYIMAKIQEVWTNG